MAITSITISQDNIFIGSNLLPIHSPLVFIVTVIYTTTAPDILKVGIYDDTSTLLDTFKCIPYEDTNSTTRKFIFIANEVIKGLMNGFDDELINLNQLTYIENITKVLRLRFYDPDVPATYDEETFTFIHGSKQFSERPNLDTIFANTPDVYYALKNSFVYVYFFNSNAANVLVYGELFPTLVADPMLLEFGNEVINGTYQTYEFLLTGNNLTEDVTLTAPTHFVFSETHEGPVYVSSLIITPVAGEINKWIYVAFRPLAVVSYDEILTIESELATINVQLTGAGDPL